MSNYPPGVTGNEFEIAGPDWEGVMWLRCPNCDHEEELDAQGYRGEFWADCPACGYHIVWYLTDNDSDEEYERERDRDYED